MVFSAAIGAGFHAVDFALTEESATWPTNWERNWPRKGAKDAKTWILLRFLCLFAALHLFSILLSAQ
jgi:hypothetical protein